MTRMAMDAPGLSLGIPSSRQDVVSALLNDYGTSFGQDEAEAAFALSAPCKELPPPPPPGHGEKPLPPGLMTKFQLRVDEHTSPDGSRNQSPTSITSTSISRSSKPRSLKLKVSNGSTAIVLPSPPAPKTPAKDTPSPPAACQPFDERPLPPPPPPQKSERRKTASKPEDHAAMGHRSSKPDRRDSKEPHVAAAGPDSKAQSGLHIAHLTKRKPLPPPALPNKFPSLADLKHGPRGRAGTVHSVASDADSDKTITQTGSHDSAITLTTTRPSQTNTPPQLPPTPDELPTDREKPAPPPPPKPYAGLPSNPRAKNQDAAKAHAKGKSSTGFDVMKNFTAALNMGATKGTITPARTPSPAKAQHAQPQGPQAEAPADTAQPAAPEPSPPSPPPLQEQHWEATPPAQHQATTLAATLASPSAAPPPETAPQLQPPPQTQFPPRTSSASADPQAPFPPRTTSRPTGPSAQPTVVPHHAETPPAAAEHTDADASFVPLTKAPITITPARPITARHLHCYTNHATMTQYQSRFQTVACMVCGQAERGLKCSCAWCMLQLCIGCRDELRRLPGRDLGALLAKAKTSRGT